MKIGIYDPYLDDLGGGEKYMMSIASCLSKDHNVSVFWDKREDMEKVSERFSLDLSKVEVAKNIFAKTIPTIKRVNLSKQYDVIVILSDGSIPFVLSKKLFVHIQQPLSQFQKSGVKNSIKFSRIRKIFCNSEYTKSHMSPKLIRKAVVIYPPVELKSKNVKKENIILHVGRFRTYDTVSGASDFKKQHVMIDAFKKMIDQGLINWKFILAVSVLEKDFEEFEKVKQSTKNYPIEFLVNKSNDELWSAYSRAKIYWHASGFGEDLDKHPEYAEHFGISTVEAMGAGCVPVVINAGGQREIVTDGENGFLWESLDVLQEKTVLLTHDEALWEQLSKNAMKRAETFSIVRFNEDIQKLMNE